MDTGRVLLAFRHLPLEQIHPAALKAAEAAECSRQQGKFWDMHDSLFADQKKLDEPSLLSRARRIGLNTSEFQGCLDGTMTSKVRSEAADARALGITGTPTFLVGTVEPDGQVRVVRRASGALPLEAFARIVDQVGEAISPAK